VKLDFPSPLEPVVDGQRQTMARTWSRWLRNLGEHRVPPAGMILWDATADLPVGWYLCDGTNGTLNLAGLAPAGTVYVMKA
jgi:hypothetical protein